ncbi:MAG: hypothetical protein HYX92_14225 [Chloroflexi bacterium]|nr:hypothetical protein [Chloroflexota bacterium]
MAEAVTKVPAENRKAIRKAFPLISRIKDKQIRDGVVKAWYIAWRESSFDKLEDCPFALQAVPGDNLVKHINASTAGAYAMGKQLQREYDMKLDLDHIIAGGLLQNLDKLVMLEKKGEKIVLSPLGTRIVHGAYGGHIALLAGLPQDIVFIIMAHSPSVKAEPGTPEASLICHTENATVRALHAASGVPLSGGH